MPKSVTCPGDIAAETSREMDRAESCDSIVSFNCASDESLKYLSAEEKACLMFLEETIESLATEDTGLSGDDAESLPVSGNTTSKRHCITDPSMLGSTDHHQVKNYLVPTPFVLAICNANIPPKQRMTASNEKPPPHVNKTHLNEGLPGPTEVNVAASPPPLTFKNSNGNSPEVQNDQPSSHYASPRGPLSHEGLVELRKTVSMKKKPAIEKQLSTHDDSESQNVSESRCMKPNPPAVAPKPKSIPSHIAVLNHKGTTSPNADTHCLSTSPGNRVLTEPEKVRLEALSKLGLLQEDVKPPTLRDTQTSGPPQLSSNSAPDFPQCDNLRNQEPKNQVEKSGMELEIRTSNEERSALQGSSQSSTAPPTRQKPSHAPGVSVPMVPNMGEDRRQALRKLGLLKD